MKKQLLQEMEIRKMMKFANIGALSDGFVDKLNETFETEVNEEEQINEEEEDLPGEEDALAMDAPDVVEPEDVDEPEPDLGPEPEGEEGAEMSPVIDHVNDLVDSLRAALAASGDAGQEAADLISVEKTGEEGGGGMTSPDAPMSMDPDAEGDDLEGMSMVDDEPVGLEDEEETLNEVARRVARRLGRMRRKR